MLQTDWIYRRDKVTVLNLPIQINCSSLSILTYHISCYGLSINRWLISSYPFPFIRWLAVCGTVRMSLPAYTTRLVPPCNYCNHVLQCCSWALPTVSQGLADRKGLFGSCWFPTSPLYEVNGLEATAPVMQLCAELWWLISFNIWSLLKTLIHN
jgi:hypothetical protein